MNWQQENKQVWPRLMLEKKMNGGKGVSANIFSLIAWRCNVRTRSSLACVCKKAHRGVNSLRDCAIVLILVDKYKIRTHMNYQSTWIGTKDEEGWCNPEETFQITLREYDHLLNTPKRLNHREPSSLHATWLLR